MASGTGTRALAGIKAVIFDLDGTLYLGKTAIAGAGEAIRRLKKQGRKVFFLTNAATRSRAGVAAKLRQMGFMADEKEVLAGAYLLARYIARNYPGKTVYVVGERGMHEEFAAAGIKEAEEADIVAVGLDREFTYDKLARAFLNIRRGAVFLASNMDNVFPTEEGELPGTGSIAQAIEFSTKRKPYVVGKPNTLAFEILKKEHNLKAEEVLFVGDRLDTDLAFAKACGIRSCLVLSGHVKKEGVAGISGTGLAPDVVLESVAELNLP
jgi:4-nitrophenyl phosphatase